MKATFYQVLGIPPNAKLRQIRSAIRSMIKTATIIPSLTPDDLPEPLKSPEAPVEILRLAYYAIAILLDPKKRSQYDQSIADGAHILHFNRNRYQTLLQYTGGAIRKMPIKQPILHPTPGNEHLSLLPIGFKLTYADYWSNQNRFLTHTLLSLLLLGQIFYTALSWKTQLQHHDSEWVSTQLTQSIQTTSALLLIPGIILLLYMIKHKLSTAEKTPEETPIALDNTDWDMFELSATWEQGNCLFLGEDPLYMESPWSFSLYMNHFTRTQKQMLAISIPWRRFWARCIDMSIWGSILLTSTFLPFFFRLTLLPNHPFVITLVWLWFTMLTWVFIEALILSFIGSTPGRYLSGITLHFQATSTLRKHYSALRWHHHFISALKRTLAVWWRGLGAGFIPLSIWLTIKFLTTRQNHTETQWDAHADTITLTHPITAGHITLGAGWIFCAISLWVSLCFSNT